MLVTFNILFAVIQYVGYRNTQSQYVSYRNKTCFYSGYSNILC